MAASSLLDNYLSTLLADATNGRFWVRLQLAVVTMADHFDIYHLLGCDCNFRCKVRETAEGSLRGFWWTLDECSDPTTWQHM